MAARFCPECGQETSSAARFCPNCAARLDGADPNVGAGPSAGPSAGPPRVPRPPLMGTPLMGTSNVTQMDLAAQKSRKLLIPGMLAALVVLAIAVAVLAAQSRRQPSLLVSASPSVSAPALTDAPAAPPGSAPAVTNAPTAPPGSAPAVTNAPTAPTGSAPAVTNAPTTPAPSLPPDVAAYLTFLQQIETRRVAMNSDVSGASAMLAMAQGMGGISGGGMPDLSNDPEGTEDDKKQAAKQDAAKQNMQKISQGYNDYALKWQGLVRDFRATPPPPACTTLAGRYLTFLGDYTTIISKMQVALLNHDSSSLPDLSAVAQVQGQVNTDGGIADSELGNLCGHYGVPKPFVIAPEGAAPSLLGH